MRIFIGLLLLAIAVIHIQSERHHCGRIPLGSDYWFNCITQQPGWDMTMIPARADR